MAAAKSKEGDNARRETLEKGVDETPNSLLLLEDGGPGLDEMIQKSDVCDGGNNEGNNGGTNSVGDCLVAIVELEIGDDAAVLDIGVFGRQAAPRVLRSSAWVEAFRWLSRLKRLKGWKQG